MPNHRSKKNTSKTIRILFLHPGYSSFIKEDIKILERRYNLTTYFLRPHKHLLRFTFQHIKFFLFFLRNITHTDIVYTWFCDYHAFSAGFLAKLFHKKHIVVVAGFDAVSIPAISFGLFYKNNLRARLARKTYSWADKILTVDKSLIKGVNFYIEGNNIIGIANFDKNLIKKSISIPFGYDSNYWNCNNPKKKNQILSVGIAPNNTIAIRKGFDIFINCAKQMPQYNFVYIGLNKGNSGFHFDEISNLTVIEKVSQDKLKEYFCESKVFAQFSVSEGLPNTLCEAMLCECIAVGSNVNGIPTVIRDKHFILEKKNLSKATEILKKAMLTDPKTSLLNRRYIQANYKPEFRAKAIYNVIDNILR